MASTTTSSSSSLVASHDQTHHQLQQNHPPPAPPTAITTIAATPPPPQPQTKDPSPPTSTPLLPHLVAHLIAAKRALAATAHVRRANVLVAAARRRVEALAALDARAAFLRRHAGRELRALEGVGRRLRAVRELGAGEFKAVLRTLDASDSRVKQTLHLLQTTPVEASFQSRVAEGEQPEKTDADYGETGADKAVEQKQKQKHLYDFVSEQGVDDLAHVFRQCIDATNDATETYDGTIEAFDAELQAISDVLASASRSSGSRRQHQQQQQQQGHRASTQETPEDDNYQQQPHADDGETAGSLFRSLEAHATEMASLLQSLVRHYDLCVTALKHTEGGGEAAAQAQAQADMPGGLAEFDRETPHEPISEEERSQMIAVLDKDALEVDDVVQEMRDYAAEMEGQLEVLSGRVEASKSEHDGLNAAVRLFDALDGRLQVYIEASATFLDRWAEQKGRIRQNMEELDALRDFYDGFLGAYDGLILEIGRRKAVQTKMERVVADAMARVTKLYNEDIEDREAFKLQQGEYLPSDIWTGLVDPPVKFEVHRSDQGESSLPEVSKEAMQRAMQRHGKGL